MLHALGITHVVSVGECALVPPPEAGMGDSGCPSTDGMSAARPTFIPGHHQNRSRRGSLWTEEREGRIKVLDIKGVCDDGIDTLEPQLGPICEWIDRARSEGGNVLVHCRVGVSRSATVTVRLSSQILLVLALTNLWRRSDRICDEASFPFPRRRLSHRALATTVGVDPAEHAPAVQPVRVGDQTRP